jgi:predicted transcriptional regulator
VNVVMVLFNLLPAFPMDGGRVLRALLAMWTNPVAATRLAASVGQMMALMFVVAALLLRQPMLVFVAMFVWLSGGAEAADAVTRNLMKGVTAKQAMVSNFLTIAPSNTLHDVSLHVVSGFQQDFPVVEGDQVVGILTRNALLKALGKHGRQFPVADVMHKKFERAEVGEPLSHVFERLSDSPCRVLPVMDEGRLVGVIDMENVGEFVALRAAIRASDQA